MDVYLASGNQHKFEEMVTLIHKHRLEINFMSALEAGGMPDVDESGSTLDENALLKAKALLGIVPRGSWVLSDDSGLLVDALDGAPGVHSSRYAGPGGNATANNIKLLQELKGVEMSLRTARFSCTLCFCQAGSEVMYFRGNCEGHIMKAPSGLQGFGYDPLFQPMGYNRTFADLGSAIKNILSHRAIAVGEWAAYLNSLGT
jgi:XTP/dITP diphosphohydrolase